jgi:type VI protein secretion system component Hcp
MTQEEGSMRKSVIFVVFATAILAPGIVYAKTKKPRVHHSDFHFVKRADKASPTLSKTSSSHRFDPYKNFKFRVKAAPADTGGDSAVAAKPAQPVKKGKKRGPNLFKYSTSGKHIPEAKLTARTKSTSPLSKNSLRAGPPSTGLLTGGSTGLAGQGPGPMRTGISRGNMRITTPSH